MFLVPSALCRIGNGNERYTNDLESIVCYIINEVRTLDLDILDRGNERNRER